MNATKSIRAITAGVLLLPVVLYADSGPAAADKTTGQSKEAASLPPQPIQLALVPDLQLVPAERSIQGFRLNIYGCNQNVTGVDIGLVHEAKGDFHGAEFGVVNIVHGNYAGIQLAGIYSDTKTHITGWQVGMATHAGSMSGFQLGFVNMADDMDGLQIGLINIINSKENWKVLPLVNAKF